MTMWDGGGQQPYGAGGSGWQAQRWPMQYPVAGWYADPHRPGWLRYWNGASWTEHVHSLVPQVPLGPGVYPGSSLYTAQPVQQSRRGNGGLVAGIVAGSAAVLVMVLFIVVLTTASNNQPSWSYEADDQDHAVDAPAPSFHEDWMPTGAPDPDMPLVGVEVPEVPYPVFGSTELVRYLAVETMLQSDEIDVSFLGDDIDLVMPVIDDAMLEVLSQNPYVFLDTWWVDQTATGIVIDPDYYYADDEAEQRRADIAAGLTAALEASGAAAEPDPAKQVTAIHDWLASNVTYDWDAADDITAGLNTERVYASQDPFGALVSGETVCAGYAEAFLLMTTELGLDSVVVSGSADGGDGYGAHAWNRVLIDGQWLTVDVTWDDLDGSGDGWGNAYVHDFLMIDERSPFLDTRVTDFDWITYGHTADYE